MALPTYQNVREMNLQRTCRLSSAKLFLQTQTTTASLRHCRQRALTISEHVPEALVIVALQTTYKISAATTRRASNAFSSPILPVGLLLSFQVVEQH